METLHPWLFLTAGHVARSGQHVPEFQTPLRKAGAQHPSIAHPSCLGRVNLAYWVTPRKCVSHSDSQATPEGLVLEAGFTKDSSYRPALVPFFSSHILTLFLQKAKFYLYWALCMPYDYIRQEYIMVLNRLMTLCCTNFPFLLGKIQFLHPLIAIFRRSYNFISEKILLLWY